MKVTLYTLPIAGASPLSIPALQPDRRVEITEDDSVTNQGIVVKFPYDNFTQAFTYAPSHQPVTMGALTNTEKGSILGQPIQMDAGGTVVRRPADILCKVTSATATATKIRVVEYS